MPIPSGTYQTFAEIATDLGHTSYAPQWSRTSECDRLLNVIFDSSLNPDTTNAVTMAQRFNALNYWLDIKWGLATPEFDGLPAESRTGYREFSLNSSLVAFVEEPTARTGELERALTAVWNETPGHPDKQAAYQQWCANAVQGIAAALGIAAPPAPGVPTTDGGTDGGNGNGNGGHSGGNGGCSP